MKTRFVLLLCSLVVLCTVVLVLPTHASSYYPNNCPAEGTCAGYYLPCLQNGGGPGDCWVNLACQPNFQIGTCGCPFMTGTYNPSQWQIYWNYCF
jgi:hypothetical protein